MALQLSPQQFSRVKSTRLFQDIDEFITEWVIRSPQCRLEQYRKGDVIFDQTCFQRCLGIILEGEVQVEKPSASGQTLTISRLGAGEYFGAASMFADRDSYVAVITAVRETEVLFLPEEVLRWAMRRDYAIAENYIRYLSDRIWFLQGTISGLSAGSVTQRLGRYLLDRCRESGTITVTMTGLSRQLNIGRASLYRAMDNLEAQGWIRREGKRIQVISRDALENMVQGF